MNARPAGPLDGVTLLRFAHMLPQRSAGGIEAHLWDLNRTLLARNRMRILQMYLVPEGQAAATRVERVGRGELTWIPSTFRGMSAEKRTAFDRFGAFIGCGINTALTVCHDRVLAFLDAIAPDLAVFHWISEDSSQLVERLGNAAVPLAVVNHFDNRRLALRSVRAQIRRAICVGGVTSIDVPGFLQSRFADLSDGIDTDFYSPCTVGGERLPVSRPLILLPSRVCVEKGHLDAVAAVSALSRAGLDAVLAFAGRHGTPAFDAELRRVVAKAGLQGQVLFLGELAAEGLREWYARADVVVLPSRSEGLPRVLLEAQAMAKPVIAFDVGGVRAAVGGGAGGMLIHRRKRDQLANVLLRLLRDDAARQAMGQRGRAFVQEMFSLDALADRHEAFYLRTLQPSRAGALH
jgi:glycosyltransferase involved in cell wall biosynthesis